MAKIEERTWGTINMVVYDPPVVVCDEMRAFGIIRTVKKFVYQEGYLTVNPQARIDLHEHTTDHEDYTPLSEGTKILVLTNPEAECYDEADIEARFEQVEAGTMVTCPKGCAHSLVNTTDNPVTVRFRKYREFGAL